MFLKCPFVILPCIIYLKFYLVIENYLFLPSVKSLCAYIKRILSQRNQKKNCAGDNGVTFVKNILSIARHKVTCRAISFDFMACDGRTPGIFFLGRPVL